MQNYTWYFTSKDVFFKVFAENCIVFWTLATPTNAEPATFSVHRFCTWKTKNLRERVCNSRRMKKKKKVFIPKMKKNTIYLQFNDVYRTDWKEEILLLRFSRSLWQRNDAIPLKKKKKKRRRKKEKKPSPITRSLFLAVSACF